MSKRQRVVLSIIVLGSLVYVALLHHSSAIINNPPAEPSSPEVRSLCKTSLERTSLFGIQQSDDDSLLPTIYVVTPTYLRPEMLSELTRLGQTLLLVPKIHWIVAEDFPKCSPQVTQFLEKLGLPFTHIASPMPEIYRKLKYVPRGVANRRAALQWIKEQTSGPGVLYFLDDDNTIDISLFEEMRNTEKVSMWPVGLIGTYAVSSPVINEEGSVVSFFDGWPADRKFQVDMAGFAVNIDYLKKQKKATMPYIAGHEEDGFLKSLKVELSDIEPKANSCKEILVWHTRTKRNPVRSVSIKKHLDDNIYLLVKEMKKWGMLK